MDPKVIAIRKAAALERIECGLKDLVNEFKFDAGLADQLRRAYGDPQLAELLLLEQVAELVNGLGAAADAAQLVRGVQGLPDGRELARGRK